MDNFCQGIVPKESQRYERSYLSPAGEGAKSKIKSRPQTKKICPTEDLETIQEPDVAANAPQPLILNINEEAWDSYYSSPYYPVRPKKNRRQAKTHETNNRREQKPPVEVYYTKRQGTSALSDGNRLSQVPQMQQPGLFYPPYEESGEVNMAPPPQDDDDAENRQPWDTLDEEVEELHSVYDQEGAYYDCQCMHGKENEVEFPVVNKGKSRLPPLVTWKKKKTDKYGTLLVQRGKSQMLVKIPIHESQQQQNAPATFRRFAMLMGLLIVSVMIMIL